jgi:hypothetical protein
MSFFRRFLGLGRSNEGGWYGGNGSSSEFGGDDAASLRSNGLDLQSLWDGQSFAGGSRYTPDSNRHNSRASGTNSNSSIAYSQTVRVQRIRIVFCIMWILCTVLVTMVVYRKSNQLQQERTISQYHQTTDQIRTAFETIPRHLIGMLSSFQDLPNSIDNDIILNDTTASSNQSTTATTTTTTKEWPFVTLTSFAHRAAVIRHLYTSIVQISIHPIVPQSLQSQWGSYAVPHQSVWM